MNRKEIEQLIRFVAKSGVSEVSIESKDFKITIKNSASAVVPPVAPVPAPVVITPAASALPVTPPSVISEKAPVSEITEEKKSDESKLHVIKSPMIGTFYRAPGPDKPNFVNVGDEVKPGQTICIIEAMKLFNEIEADIAGRVVKILVENASPVEYDQPLFLIEPI
jgi:acetyl-CoA carboxylase biotin carboxyl carrier protein